MRALISAIILSAAAFWGVAGAAPASAEKSADSLVRKARVEWGRGDFGRAKWYLDAAIKKVPDHHDAHALLCSMSMLEAGMESRAFATPAEIKALYLAAAKACGQAITLGITPASGTSLPALRARALVKAEAWDDAVTAYKVWIASAPDDGRIVGGYAAVLDRAGRIEDSHVALAEAAARSPEFDHAARFEFVWDAFEPDDAARLAPMITTLLEEETDERRRVVLETLRGATGGVDEFIALKFLDLVEAGVLTRPELDHLWDALAPADWSKDSADPTARDLRLQQHGIEAPRLIEGPPPEFPAAARDAHMQGRVIVLARINADGSVGPTWVVRGTAQLFAASAEKAVMARRYAPAKRNGEAIPFPFTIRVDFRLR